MEFSDFINLISKIKKIPLGGVAAQGEMAPTSERAQKTRDEIEPQNPKKAGVMALFFPDKTCRTRFVLIKRTPGKDIHAAQISFPGGQMEAPDRNLEYTALRETYEEVGVPIRKITVEKALTELYIPPSDFQVYPFLGFTRKAPVFTPQESEVETILEVKLDDLLCENNVIRASFTTPHGTLKAPAFALNGQKVWGATAMMLSEIKLLILEGCQKG